MQRRWKAFSPALRRWQKRRTSSPRMYAPDYHLVQMYNSISKSYSQLAEKYTKVKEL
jgi:hypothetical protein